MSGFTNGENTYKLELIHGIENFKIFCNITLHCFYYPNEPRFVLMFYSEWTFYYIVYVN